MIFVILSSFSAQVPLKDLLLQHHPLRLQTGEEEAVDLQLRLPQQLLLWAQDAVAVDHQRLPLQLLLVEEAVVVDELVHGVDHVVDKPLRCQTTVKDSPVMYCKRDHSL